MAFIGQGEFEAMKTLSVLRAPRCDKDQFRAKMTVCRAVAATTAGTAMAVPVFVGTKKKIILRATAHESFSLVKPDSHINGCTRARTTIEVQSSNSEHMLTAESCEWLSTASRLPEVGEVPHQPERHIFPRRQFGKSKVVGRAVQDHCSEHSELVFHAVCL